MAAFPVSNVGVVSSDQLVLRAVVAATSAATSARPVSTRTTMRYDRARKNLDRHANYILAAFMASRT